MKKYPVEVIFKSTGKVIARVSRRLHIEQMGNFSPVFCTYQGKSRLVKSRSGDLSDPFRREDSYLNSLYIEVDDFTVTPKQYSNLNS
jgi:hypothetical protein